MNPVSNNSIIKVATRYHTPFPYPAFTCQPSNPSTEARKVEPGRSSACESGDFRARSPCVSRHIQLPPSLLEHHIADLKNAAAEAENFTSVTGRHCRFSTALDTWWQWYQAQAGRLPAADARERDSNRSSSSFRPEEETAYSAQTNCLHTIEKASGERGSLTSRQASTEEAVALPPCTQSSKTVR